MSKRRKKETLSKKYPPSEPCSCEICSKFCCRPGWWTVEQASKAIEAGYAQRMMLEIEPKLSFGVLSPAFKGNEGDLANPLFINNGCSFLKNNLCELHDTGLKPLECLFAHHQHMELGMQCHKDIGAEWNTTAGRSLVKKWIAIMQLYDKHPWLKAWFSRSEG